MGSRAPFVVLACALVAVATVARAAHADAVAFGFTDHAGKKLIVLTKDAPRFAHAMCKAGEAVGVEWLSKQQGTDPPARQTAVEFDRLAGDVYVLSRAVEPNQTCVLWSDRDPLPGLVAVSATCDDATRERLKLARSRAVVRCRKLARLPKVGTVITAELQKVGVRALGVVALQGRTTMAIKDFAARCSGTQPSCWRADDGNRWDETSFSVLGAFRSPRGVELAITWAGPEGENAMLYRVVADRLVELSRAYRYWSAE